MFKQFGNELPSITVFMIDLSEMFSKYIWLMLLGLLSLIIIIYLIRSNLWFQKFWSFVVLGIPVVGKLTKKIYLSRFCHSMALMSSAKSPLIQSLDLVRTMLQFYPFDIALKAASKEVIRGAALNQALKKHKVFDRRMISLIKVAEEVNQLDAVFKRLYDQYQEEIESRIKTINSVLEPVLILLISALVGFILIAMYLPMFKMSGAVG
jgi:type IV pilus assembly protein PilC